jgi:hypothetical protein
MVRMSKSMLTSVSESIWMTSPPASAVERCGS